MEIVWVFFYSRDCPEKSVGCLGVNVALNHEFVWKRPGMGRLIGPKTWD